MSTRKGGKRHKTRGNNSMRIPKPLRERHTATVVRPITTASEEYVRLRYASSATLVNAAGGSASKSWNPNAAYDVDPAFASTETAGFDEKATLYSYYRVIGYRYRVEVVNREDDAMSIYFFNTNVAMSGSSFDVYSGNPYCKKALLTAVTGGGAKKVLSGYVSCAELLGSVAAETSDSMRSTTTSTPADLLFSTLTIASAGALATIPNGVSYQISIDMHIRFYGRRFDLTIAAMEERIAEIKKARKLRACAKAQ